MLTLSLLMASYGIAFGIQNKVPFLHEKHPFLDSLLGCMYCLGFHTGYIVYFLFLFSGAENTFSLGDLILAAFTSSAFCFSLDNLLDYLEINSIN